jgi:cytochrome c-type biogenesis protein CcmF
MAAEFGVILLLLALASAIYAIIAALVGARRNHPALIASARNAALVTWPLLTATVLLLIGFMAGNNFNIEYVWQVIDRAMPIYLKITALWGGQAGSLLFWSWLMSTFTAGAMLRNWHRERPLMPYVIAFTMGTLTFFILLVTFWENPFARFWQTPDDQVMAALFHPSAALSAIAEGWARVSGAAPGMIGVVMRGVKPLAPPLGSFALTANDGQGLNPLLRHPGMIIHPPMLYLGFVGFVVPYAFSMAALVRGEMSDAWIRTTRRWTLAAWLFLGLGLLLGGWWAYDVLGWGGYWAWDPVENAALMPWLTGTAFLHSVVIQERQGMLRRWNLFLIIFTYLQVILGTFATRSGFVSSVHSFAQGAVGPLFLLFMIISTIISFALLAKRWDDLRADRQLDSLLSRETLSLTLNFFLVVFDFIVALGTYWPVFTELLSTVVRSVERSSLGTPFYWRTTGPVFFAIIVLLALCPLVAWRRASLRRVGRALLWPAVLTALATVAIIIAGVRDPAALVGFGLAILAGLVTLLEYHRGASARVRAHGQPYPVALLRLFGRNRRRYGGYMIHFGVIVMAIGILASQVFQTQTQRALSAGQTITFGDTVLEYESLERFGAADGRIVTRASAILYRNGREAARLSPAIDSYPSGESVTIPGTYTTWCGDDFYVLLVAWEQTSLSSVTFRIYYNPLVNWIWAGGFIFILGTTIAVWPSNEPARRTTLALPPASAPAAGD